MLRLAAAVLVVAQANSQANGLELVPRRRIAGHPVRRVASNVGGTTELFVYAVVFGAEAADDASVHDALATQLWPSGRVAARFLVETCGPGDSVLEIGAGTALPSLAAALAGADVLATDRDETSLDFALAAAEDQGLEIRTATYDVEATRPLPPGDVVVFADVFVSDAVASACAIRAAEALERGSRCVVADARRSTRDAFLETLRGALDGDRRLDFLPIADVDRQDKLQLIDAEDLLAAADG